MNSSSSEPLPSASPSTIGNTRSASELRRARQRFQALVAESRRTGEPLDLRDLEARLLEADDDETTRRDRRCGSPRVLAEQWGVSVFTIGQAMKTLADEGLIENQSRSRRIMRSNQRPGPVNRPAPYALLIGGHAGSGKTELGRILSRQTGWPIIDKDTITRPLVETALEALGQPANDRDSETYVGRIRPREYEALMATAHENTGCGAGAMITAPFVREFADPAWIERERSQFASDGVPAVLVWVACDSETMHTYLRRRGAARDAAKLSGWDEYLAKIDLDFRPPSDHIVIDNSATAEPLNVQADRLLATLRERASR